ncbi:MAG TPA: alternative ribosome rescue aminoacyl-tRNA hydrolase ArfB [Actinomycetota bacterium]|nr:alternative ribosome rescue aminoacyl-tRNA hydrolase ArfB [Actinomycetota bacterium]
MDAVRAGHITIPGDELEVRFSRSSGPGGQNVNKRDTRVEVLFNVLTSRAFTPRQRALAVERLGARLDAHGRIRVTSGAARTQTQNRARALERLGEIMADALRPPPKVRRKSAPSKGAKERRLKEKSLRSAVKQKRRRPADED